MNFTLLQAGETATVMFLIVLLCGGGFLIAVFITRWIFGITTILENLKYQSQNLTLIAKLTVRMAEQAGVPKAEIEQMKREAYKLPTPANEEVNRETPVK